MIVNLAVEARNLSRMRSRMCEHNALEIHGEGCLKSPCTCMPVLILAHDPRPSAVILAELVRRRTAH